MVGRVIGKGGETIKALQKNFGCNIQIDQTIDPMKVTVAGQPGPVESAAAAVTEIINGGNPYLGPPGGAGASGGYGGKATHMMYGRHCRQLWGPCESLTSFGFVRQNFTLKLHSAQCAALTAQELQFAWPHW